jgi:hypothetical protein
MAGSAVRTMVPPSARDHSWRQHFYGKRQSKHHVEKGQRDVNRPPFFCLNGSFIAHNEGPIAVRPTAESSVKAVNTCLQESLICHAVTAQRVVRMAHASRLLAKCVFRPQRVDV